MTVLAQRVPARSGRLWAMPHRLLRTMASAVLAFGLVGAAPATPAAAITSSSITTAEHVAHDLANTERTRRGLVPLRWDQRLADIARERSTYMAATGRFSHAHSGGSDVFDLLAGDRVAWYRASEVIAWNTTSTANGSAASAIQQWMGSSAHRAVLLHSDMNYIGYGMAVGSDGRRYWTAVAIKGPDRSPPRASITSVTEQVIDSRTMRIVIRWSGSDLPLQVLTSGLRYYETQRRIDGGSWTSYGTTTNTYASRWFTRGEPAEFRVRSRDRAGLWSPWQTRTLTP